MRKWSTCIAATLLFGCHQAPTDGGGNDSKARQASAASGRKVAVVTPELSAKADQILREHPDAEIGTEIPFELSGRKYVARLERHNNTENDPDRSRGEHKGVTVYDY